MARSELSSLAEDDLIDVWNYIAQDNIEQADKFTDELFDLFQMLAENAESGRVRNELLPNLRSFPRKRYIVFYFPTEYGVEIYRVLHSARDVDEIFD